MLQKRRKKIALVGNPNSGKTSLFNYLTGLNQKVGNFPGVTIDKKTGVCSLPGGELVDIIDLPGIYSIYPRTTDERIVAEVLLDHHSPESPDKLVVVVDTTNLRRSLLLATQCIDLGVPAILVLNMTDLAARAGLSYDLTALSEKLDVPVVAVDARNGHGLEELKRKMAEEIQVPERSLYNGWEFDRPAVREVREKMGVDNDYEAYQFLQQPGSVGFLSSPERDQLDEIRTRHGIFPGKYQGAETIQRYALIQDLLTRITRAKEARPGWNARGRRLDKIMTHRVWGYVIFFLVLLVIFQVIFYWALLPMNLIDASFASLSNFLSQHLPDGALTDLLARGLIPGLGGIVIFVPQIALLFMFIAILEETGYMARVVFIMDKVMRKFGLNGRSVVPLISGVACAIPAIMATRSIENWKERTITLLVTPLMSCSARLPVFTILIALIVPNHLVLGVLNLQGLVLMSLYLLGFLAAIGSAWIMKQIIRMRERSFLIMELPVYRWPKWSNVGYTIYEKTRAFVLGAGKIIIAISIILWVLSSYGPPREMERARQMAMAEATQQGLGTRETDDMVAAYKLENSFAGIVGKGLEPAIRPLGYDWKIGISLVTSFAAREVFVGTMATIYSIGSVEDQTTIMERMRDEINPESGGPRFTLAVGLSLLVFYTFAMQCMSTLAVVYRETKGWKWPLVQLTYMSALAYLSALLVYQLFA